MLRTFALACVTFVSMLATDFAWAKYMMHTADRDPQKAGMWSAAIVFMGAITVLAYTSDWTMVFPAAGGAYVGTFIAVRREQ